MNAALAQTKAHLSRRSVRLSWTRDGWLKIGPRFSEANAARRVSIPLRSDRCDALHIFCCPLKSAWWRWRHSMAEMIRAAKVFALTPKFDNFLFASIGEEKNGMVLSVISALARLNLDPWQEASNLAQLPRTTATRRLASLIASLPDGPLSHLDPATTASQLIAHLPRRGDLIAPSAETPVRVGTSAILQSQGARCICIALVLMVVLFGGLGLVASQRSAARPHNIGVAASGTVIPSTKK
jgi:hypothetical protein